MRNLYAQPYSYRRGSNQYRRTRKTRFVKTQTWLTIIMIALIVAIPEVAFFTSAQLGHKLDALNKSVTINVYAAPKEVINPKTDQQRDIANFIREVFGRDATKAFMLLSCENSSLNPDAVNTAGNFPKGSRDIGVFQINEYWQKVNAKFLYDYKINVMMAKKIYDDSDSSFKMWSCGKALSI